MVSPIWKPTEQRIKNANLTRFIDTVNKKHKLNIRSYDDLWKWSVTDLPDFWEAIWEFGGVRASKKYDTVATNVGDMLGVKWFPGARLNFAENLLRYRDDRVALVFKGEGQEAVKLTYAQLYDRVARLAKSLRESGVTAGDRVAGIVPNLMETVIAMLASVSIGAVWSSCSPDFGVNGILDRFKQIEPRVLFTANGYSYNGKKFNSLEHIPEIVAGIPSIKKVVVIPYTEKQPDLSRIPTGVNFYDFLAKEDNLQIKFEQLPFDHPLYIVYSSGTTGVPKCIVHRAGGILVQHLKELALNADLKREDTVFYFTTCGWVMWNWSVSSLALGVTLVLYDGSPLYPDDSALFKVVEEQKATLFGASPGFYSRVEKSGVKPGTRFDLSNLKSAVTTGAPLSIENYEYMYREIKKDLYLCNESGGTEIIACFGIGNPISPIYAGEMQGRGLGMKVEILDSAGNPVIGEEGELVCKTPFPSMPLYFWNDKDNEKYKATYFSVYPNVWVHGDYAEITERGGVIMHGRSDATLKPGGVRIGTAEIYRQVETIKEVADSVAVGQRWNNDVRVILFVKLAKGVTLTDELVKKIKLVIRSNASPRHVPDKIIAVADIPLTLNGKKVELAVRNVIHNLPVANKDALLNPQALDLFKNLKELET